MSDTPHGAPVLTLGRSLLSLLPYGHHACPLWATGDLALLRTFEWPGWSHKCLSLSADPCQWLIRKEQGMMPGWSAVQGSQRLVLCLGTILYQWGFTLGALLWRWGPALWWSLVQGLAVLPVQGLASWLWLPDLGIPCFVGGNLSVKELETEAARS